MKLKIMTTILIAAVGTMIVFYYSNSTETNRQDSESLQNSQHSVSILYASSSNVTHSDLVQMDSYNVSFLKTFQRDFNTTSSNPSILHSVQDFDTMAYRLSVHEALYKPFKSKANPDCEGIIQGDTNSIKNAKMNKIPMQPRKTIEDFYINLTANCEDFKKEMGYIDHPLSPTELHFPLAFGLAVYKEIEQVERLLRSIYRPHNFYCFHIDRKSDNQTKGAFEAIATCFDNVYVVPAPVDVKWGKFSVLQAELLCMRLLWKAKAWKYYINLTGQEFPLKTNLEIVSILQAMDGANLAQARKRVTTTKFKDRYEDAGTPPHNITPIVGSVHVALNRDFVDFSLHDKIALDFQKYLEKTHFSDEFFFSSLNHNPHLRIPGTFTGEAEEYPQKPFFLRYKNWTPEAGIYTRKCYGKFVRYICILGIADIHKAVNDIGLFANKFHRDFEPLGLDCLESWLYERTWNQYLSNETIDVSYYKHLDQVKFQYRPGVKYSSEFP